MVDRRYPDFMGDKMGDIIHLLSVLEYCEKRRLSL